MDHLDTFGCCQRAHFGGDSFTLAGAEDHYPPDVVLEPRHLDISLDLDIEMSRCSARVVTTVFARAGAVNELVLHGVGFRDVSVPTEGVSHQYDGERIILRWDADFREGEERDVEIRYVVSDPTTGLNFSKPTDTNPDAPHFAATDNESERARHWLACVDLPSVRPTLAYHLTSRADLVFLANGVLVGEDVAGNLKTSHWRLDQPCPSYLACFAVGDFIRRDEEDAGGVPIASFATRRFSPEDLKRSFGRTPAIMEWMTKRLGHAFPYPKYYQIALPAIGGAMENISLTTWDDKFVCDASLHRELEWLVDLINVHEMAHSYFGDMVVCRDFAHAWLKESWATYMQQCFAEECLGSDEGELEFYDQLQRYFSEADTKYVRPIVTRHFVSSWEMYDMHLYPGGACRLRMLRGLLGDEVFWGGVLKYLKAFAHRPAETEDFRRSLEDHSGRSLGHFFDQWFYRKGYPQLKVAFSYDAADELGSFTVEQTQVDEEKGLAAFEFDLDLGWVLHGELETKRLRISRDKETFTVKMATEPAQVRVDPFHRLLHKLDFNPGASKLITQLQHAPDPIGRIQAGETLAKTAKASALEAMDARYRDEAFWGVRKYWALALGKVATQQGVEILATWIREEEDPRVMQPLFDAAAKIQDPAISKAVRERLSGDLPHFARKAGLMALGVQRDEDAAAELQQAARREAWGGWAQGGAFLGLAKLRDEAATQELMARTEPGATPEDCRFGAVLALGQIGRLQSEAIREDVADHLIRLLRDDHQRVRRHAMLGLKELGHKRALGPLESFRQSVSAQERVEIQRAIDAIRAGAKPADKELRSELEKLQSKVRQLENDLRKVQRSLDD